MLRNDYFFRIFESIHADEHQIRHDPNNFNTIIIYVCNDKLEIVKQMLSEQCDAEQFKAYVLFVYGFDETQHFNHTLSTHLVGDGTENGHILPFQLMKSVWTNSKLYEGRKVATSGLVLKGDQPSRITKREFGSDFFAVSTAHAALTDDECLLLANSSEDFRRICQRVVGDLSFNTWYLTSKDEGGIHIAGIPIFSYRRYYIPAVQTRWFEKFMHDILLFRLCKEDLENKSWLSRHRETMNMWLQVHTSSLARSPHPQYVRKRILGILQVTDKTEIDQLENRKVKVVVSTTTGTIVPSPLQIIAQDKPREGHRICFKTDKK